MRTSPWLRTAAALLATTALLTATALLTTGCRPTEAAPIEIRIATGSPTAVYYAFGQSLATILNRELPNVRASVLVTAASAQNVTMVTNGTAELGFTQADVLPITPTGGYQVSSMARVYDDLLHLVTRADDPIHQLTDIRDRRVSVGASGSGTEVTANRLLAVAGLTGVIRTEKLGLDASVAALRAGSIDAFFFSGGLPVNAIHELAADTPVRLVDLNAYIEPLRNAYREVYVARDVPRSVYGLDPVTTIANPNFLIVGPTLPENLVYELTRLLMQRRDELAAAHPAAARLSPLSAIATEPLPMHPGAARYYRSNKP
ncbi:TAXI family TRAP transporter solute-binding subunit [Micromonospora polyrhachis]|uniref:TAXI family TRAP transporter solute-binding subunit n=1 Tax=Micromonospora polyrhachis TaxID=1282883 RepID=UPI0035E3FBDC